MNQPLFTVLTLCYNHEPYLDDYFNGLLSQTYSNVQLIIHDDCSTDNSWHIIKHYLPLVSAKFQEVICERSEQNLGMWGAFLKVTDSSRIRGKYLSILESDDYYLPSRIARVVEFLEARQDVGLVHTASYRLDEETKHQCIRAHAVEDVSGDLFESLLQENFITQCSVAHRVSAFKQLDLTKLSMFGYRFVDYAINLAAARITRFGYIDVPLVVYRVRSGSASRPKKAVDRYEFMKSVFKAPIDATVRTSTPPQISQSLLVRYHSYILTASLPLGRFADFEVSSDWLRCNSPETIARFTTRIKILLFQPIATRQILWKLAYHRLAIGFRVKLHSVLSQIRETYRVRVTNKT